MSRILVFKFNISITNYNLHNLLCGDVESNPLPKLLSLQTFECYEKHKANANWHPCFVYTNNRSVDNKHEEVSGFLQQQNTQTCFIVTET